MHSRRPYVRALAGFSLAILFFFATTAAFESRAFRPSEEFKTPAQLIAFSIVAQGGLLVICSGTAFALGLAMFALGRRHLPVPFSLGFLGGLLAAVLAALGLVGHFGRSVPHAFLVAAALPGFVAALAILPLAFLCTRTRAVRTAQFTVPGT